MKYLLKKQATLGAAFDAVLALTYLRWVCILLVFTGIALPKALPAANITWTGAVSTDWGDAANWLPMSVPGAADDVLIPNTPDKPVIMNGTTATVHTVWIQPVGRLTIEVMGRLDVNGSRTTIGMATTAFHNEGRLDNYGKINIGNTGSVGLYGFWNDAGFFNYLNAELNIDRSTSIGLLNALGTFNNDQGKVAIGSNAPVGTLGIYNLNSFSNFFGLITIDRTSTTGFVNELGTVNNRGGSILIGGNFPVGLSGIINIPDVGMGGSFVNNFGGKIFIDRASDVGIYHTSETFVNRGSLVIGQTVPPVIGLEVAVGAFFLNELCGKLTQYAPLKNRGTFNNFALHVLNTTNPHVNTGTYNNEWLLNYFQSNFIPNVVNNGITIKPISGGGATISNAFQLGSGAGVFDIRPLWYNEPSNITVGAKYIGATNSLTLNPPFPPQCSAIPFYGIIAYAPFECEIPVVLLVGYDDTNPGISCPANIIRPTAPGRCDAVVAYSVPAGTDNCPGATTMQTAGLPSGAVFQLGTTTNIFTVTDALNRTASCSFTVTVVDDEPPSINCPANRTLGTDPNMCKAVVTYPKPVAADNCVLLAGQPIWVSGGTGTTVNLTTATATFNAGVTTVVWRATDVAGLTKTCSFRVVVTDTQAPTIVCPVIPPVNTALGTCSAVVTYGPAVATDNCTVNPAITRVKGPISGATIAAGSKHLIFRATDASGRTATCSVLVTVVDNQPPTITCPGNIVATGGGIPCTAVAIFPPATAMDNCDGILMPFQSQGLASGSVFPEGTTLNKWHALALNGQEAECSFTVTVTNCPGISAGSVESRDGGIPANQVGLRLVPNPAYDRAVVVVEGLGTEGGRLLLFDVVGRLVWEQQLPPAGAELPMELPVGDWQQGAYQVVLRTSERTMAKPLIIVHR